MGEVTHAGAAIFLFDRNAVQAKRAHLGPKLARKRVGLVDLDRERRDLIVREAAHCIAQLVDLGAEIEIQHGVTVTRHRVMPPQ